MEIELFEMAQDLKIDLFLQGLHESAAADDFDQQRSGDQAHCCVSGRAGRGGGGRGGLEPGLLIVKQSHTS